MYRRRKQTMDEITLFTAIKPPPPDDADAIRRQARARLTAAMAGPRQSPGRRRRPLALIACGAAVAAAAAIVVPAITGSGGASPVASAHDVHVNLAAWSVNTSPDGTVTFTERRGTDPGRLQQALAKAGVPAVVRFGELCSPVGGSLPQERSVLKGPYHVGPHYVRTEPRYDPFQWKIIPSAMPKAAKLVISELRPVRTPRMFGGPVYFALVRDGQHLRCTTK
jgi:hypothetical protein